MTTVIFDPATFTVLRLDFSSPAPTGEGTADAPTVTEWPASPAKGLTLRWRNGLVWEDDRPLGEQKAERHAYVNASRLAANQTSFTFQGKAIAADPLSRSDIDAINGEVANMGTFPTGWPGAWKCLDNSWVPIATPADWHAFYSAMVLQGTVNFAHAQDLKGQIDAATTPEQVAAVTW